MYIPILRGKRFELLALRQGAALLGKSGKLLPVIEPVREKTLDTDVFRAASALADQGVKFGIVVNPLVGELVGDDGMKKVLDSISSWPRTAIEGAQLVFACADPGNQGLALEAVLARPELSGFEKMILFADDFEVQRLGHDSKEMRLSAILAPRGRIARRLAAGVVPAPSILEVDDPFPAMQRNADYLTRGETVFTDQHIYYSAEGLDGFADYMTVGKDFRDGGGSPNFVAIHWTYTKPTPREDGFPVYLQHFCSTTREADFDVAAKFHAAARSLVGFLDEHAIPQNSATDELRSHVDNETFPGLGVLKKLSILNHLHVMAGVL